MDKSNTQKTVAIDSRSEAEKSLSEDSISDMMSQTAISDNPKIIVDAKDEAEKSLSEDSISDIMSEMAISDTPTIGVDANFFRDEAEKSLSEDSLSDMLSKMAIGDTHEKDEADMTIHMDIRDTSTIVVDAKHEAEKSLYEESTSYITSKMAISDTPTIVVDAKHEAEKSLYEESTSYITSKMAISDTPTIVVDAKHEAEKSLSEDSISDITSKMAIIDTSTIVVDTKDEAEKSLSEDSISDIMSKMAISDTPTIVVDAKDEAEKNVSEDSISDVTSKMAISDTPTIVVDAKHEAEKSLYEESTSYITSKMAISDTPTIVVDAKHEAEKSLSEDSISDVTSKMAISDTPTIVVDAKDEAEKSGSQEVISDTTTQTDQISDSSKIVVDVENEAEKSVSHVCKTYLTTQMAVDDSLEIDCSRNAEAEDSVDQWPQKDTSVAVTFVEPKTVDTDDKGPEAEEQVPNIEEPVDTWGLLTGLQNHKTVASESDKVKKQVGSNSYRSGQLPVFMWDSSSEEDESVKPHVDINYENIFEDVSKLSAVEKHLQLLYRPFSCVIEMICRFNIFELCILISDSSYDPGCHPSVSVRTVNPTGLVKIYAGGKMVSTALTAESALTCLFKVVRMVEELDFKMDVNNLSQNIVHASFCMPFSLDLDRLYEQHTTKVTRNCRARPFITYSTEGEDIVFAVFPSGFVLVLHSTKHSKTRAAIAALLPILAQYKDGSTKQSEKQGRVCGDVSFKLLWEHRLEQDKDSQLLYS
ncbi:serine-rich adhesin for platelets isoform X25 [Drosophila miranda]|uniref:serine-rich adhesin for platelets isoform X25 n=1 Tax=Drosophila miranda TaxID=7229 RepID=UPI00143F8435|nr:serine-rich adhesin for platelets isoform X25 [Drosophila miranda]